MPEDLDTPMHPMKESIKLIKMSHGKYNWEIKIFPNGQTDKQWLDRMEELNNELQIKYGVPPIE
jgi:hypothetical protein